ncbi:MAG: DUF4352 domain-containing protein [Acidimicrobiia bacterium]
MEAERGGGGAVCAEHGAATRLTCVQCRTPICPGCLVRTPVGMKCLKCGDKPGRPVHEDVARRPQRAGWLVPLAVVAALALGVGLPRLLSSGGGEPVPDAEALAGGAPDPSGRARQAQLGGEARDADLAFVVNAVDCGAREVPLAGGGVRVAQGQYCLVALDVRNVSRDPATFTGRGQLLVDSADRRFELDVLATVGHPANDGRDLLQTAINPGNQLSGVLVFDVPHDVRLRSVALQADQAGPGAIVWLGPR